MGGSIVDDSAMKMQQNLRNLYYPPGLEFNPTDELLVGFYLFKKIKNKLSEIHDIFVPYCDLFGKEEPWELWEKFRPKSLCSTKDDLYFFSQLKNKGSKNKARKIGKGKWHGGDKGNDFEVNVGEVLIKANRKRFNYRNPKSRHHGRWIMHQFSLINLNTNWVLCRLRNNGGGGGGSVVHQVKRKRRRDCGSDVVVSGKRARVEDSDRACSSNVVTEFRNLDSDAVACIDNGLITLGCENCLTAWDFDSTVISHENVLLGCQDDLTERISVLSEYGVRAELVEVEKQEFNSDGAEHGKELMGCKDDLMTLDNNSEKHFSAAINTTCDAGIEFPMADPFNDEALISMDDLFDDGDDCFLVEYSKVN